MPLNKLKPGSDMYDWINATWNPIRGICLHDCSYCKVKKINNYPLRLEEKEFKTNLIGHIKIFLGSSIDIFVDNILEDWLIRTFVYCKCYPGNQYILHTKNPARMINLIHFIPRNSLCGITLETDHIYPNIMNHAPTPAQRWAACKNSNLIDFITIEPVMDFDLKPFLKMITDINPKFINIGANTNKWVHLPEPDKPKLHNLIDELKATGYEVKLKPNLNRLL